MAIPARQDKSEVASKTFPESLDRCTRIGGKYQDEEEETENRVTMVQRTAYMGYVCKWIVSHCGHQALRIEYDTGKDRIAPPGKH